MLEDLRLKITPPNEFNDPFEVTPYSKFTYSLKDLRARVAREPQYLKEVYDKTVELTGYPHPFERFIADVPTVLPPAFKAFKRQFQEMQRDWDLRQIDEASGTLGILCVSRLNDSIAMWSHYANHHRGIALGFDLSHPCLGVGRFGQFEAVHYRSRRWRFDPSFADGTPEWFRELKGMIFRKSRIWEYEQEYRAFYLLNELLHPPAGPDGKRHYFLNIDAGAIREVIFGCCVEPTYEQQIRAELIRRPKTFGHIKLLRCQRHPTRFELQVRPA